MEVSKKWTKERKRKIIIKICIAVVLLLIASVIAYELDIAIERNTYKLLYTDEILQYSNEYGLDPYLVAAIIHVESGNKAEAKSNKGAMGLMQIMPDTGEWIAGKLNIKDFSKVLLLKPAVNIEFGCWYLNYLSGKFKNQEAVLAAYNAGPGNVSEWLANSKYSADGESIDSIPFDETSNYVKKVQRAYEKYTKLYKKELQANNVQKVDVNS